MGVQTAFLGGLMDQLDYRRAVGSDVWHWNSNCPAWPTKAYECRSSKPTSGSDCKQCNGQESSSVAEREGYG